MSRKVKCVNCTNITKDGFCKIKSSSVKLNKRRLCPDFDLDSEKNVKKIKPKSRYVPLWQLDGTERRKMVKKLEAEKTKKQQSVINNPSYMSTVDKNPDCLSGIRSSVEE